MADAQAKGARLLTGGARLDRPGLLLRAHRVRRGAATTWRSCARRPSARSSGSRRSGTTTKRCGLMNDTEYGLTAGVYTGDEARARRILAGVNSGSAYWNCCDRVSPRLPWSGRRHSGSRGHAGAGRDSGLRAAQGLASEAANDNDFVSRAALSRAAQDWLTRSVHGPAMAAPSGSVRPWGTSSPGRSRGTTPSAAAGASTSTRTTLAPDDPEIQRLKKLSALPLWAGSVVHETIEELPQDARHAALARRSRRRIVRAAVHERHARRLARERGGLADASASSSTSTRCRSSRRTRRSWSASSCARCGTSSRATCCRRPAPSAARSWLTVEDLVSLRRGRRARSSCAWTSPSATARAAW